MKAGGEGEDSTRWLDDITDSMNMILGTLWEIMKYRKGWCVSVQDTTEPDTTEQLNNSNNNKYEWFSKLKLYFNLLSLNCFLLSINIVL